MENQSNTKIKTSRLLIMCLLFSIVGNGQISKRLDSLALAYSTRGFNGNVLYSKNDSIIFTGNYGFIDYSTKERLNDSTVFELASCSKQFTALAIVQLVEKNLFGYDTHVHEIIKEFPYKQITVEHLLKHQSGLPDYQKILYDKRNWNRKKMASNQNVTELLAELELDLNFESGTKYEYNNTGYAILAEKVSGQSYRDYITQYIFLPAGMESSGVYYIEENTQYIQNHAHGFTYNKRKDNYQEVEKDKNHKHIHWMNGIIGDRGIYSSILDLEKWKRAIRDNLLVTEKSKKKMMSVDKISSKYGFGWAIYETKSKGKWVYHNGSWSGYKTMTLYLPKSNEFLTILSNNRFEETYKKFEEDFYKLIQ